MEGCGSRCLSRLRYESKQHEHELFAFAAHLEVGADHPPHARFAFSRWASCLDSPYSCTCDIVCTCVCVCVSQHVPSCVRCHVILKFQSLRLMPPNLRCSSLFCVKVLVVLHWISRFRHWLLSIGICMSHFVFHQMPLNCISLHVSISIMYVCFPLLYDDWDEFWAMHWQV